MRLINKILFELEAIKQKGEKNIPCHGICWLMTESIPSTLMALWPEFSGDHLFPVPHPFLDPQTAYRDGDLWVDDYGSARLRLLDFLIHFYKNLKYETITSDDYNEALCCMPPCDEYGTKYFHVFRFLESQNEDQDIYFIRSKSSTNNGYYYKVLAPPKIDPEILIYYSIVGP
jgi:hypothetical protein